MNHFNGHNFERTFLYRTINSICSTGNTDLKRDLLADDHTRSF